MSRTKGSKNKPKTDDGLAPKIQTFSPKGVRKPIILNGPVFDDGKITKRLNELTNHEPIPFVEMPDDVFELPAVSGRPEGLAIDADKYEINFPSNWNEMGKVDRLK